MERQNGKWVRALPRSSPQLALRATVSHAAYKELGIRAPSSHKETDIIVTTDSGAQISVMPLKDLRALHLSQSDLIPVNARVAGAAKNSTIDVVGVVFLNIKYKGENTDTMMYVASNVTRTYISLNECINLKLINKGFPQA